MYAAEVGGQHLTFEVAGVYRRNMIIRDRQTRSLWQHATGEALMGPLQGLRLIAVGGEQSSWSSWRGIHPQTTLTIEPPPKRGRHPGVIPRPRLIHLLETLPLSMALPGQSNDHRLDMHEEVIGVDLDGFAKAYPLDTLRTQGIANDTLGQQAISLLYDADADKVTALRRQVDNTDVTVRYEHGDLIAADGDMRWTRFGIPLSAETPALRRLRVQRQWWLGWSEFHPNSDVYEQGS